MREDNGGSLRDQADPGWQECVVGRYRKRPVVIEAMQFDGSNASADAILDWMLRNGGGGSYFDADMRCLVIATLEGDMDARADAWVIKGVRGEFYPCKPDIFAATYEQDAVVAGPPANEVSHPLSSAASEMKRALMKITKRLDDQKVHGIDPSQDIEDFANAALASASRAGIK